MGGTTPNKLSQNYIFGDNDVLQAKAVRFRAETLKLYKAQGFTDEWLIEYLTWLFDEIVAWESDLIDVFPLDDKIWETSFISEATGDGILLGSALLLIYIYSIAVLGSCSPVHMRIISAVIGLTCVGLSIGAGYGISFLAGYKFSRMHGVLPFLILGLGVDDMFVIVNTID